MNKSYRSVWSETLGTWVAASELARARGKRGSVVAAIATMALGGLLTGGAAQAQTIVIGTDLAPADNGAAFAAGLGAIAIGNQAYAQGVGTLAIGDRAGLFSLAPANSGNTFVGQ